jgi:hypothetical protein
MSAIITLRQREAVHILCDGAGYDSEGTVRAVMSKAFAIPHLAAVIATRGSAVALPFLGTRLSALFSGFDELVSGIETELPQIVHDSEEFFAISGANSTELAVIGWSDQNDSGMAFTIQTGDANDTRAEYVDLEQPESFKLVERPDAFALPAPSAEIMRVAAHGFLDADIDKLVPAVDLLHIMEMQRQSLIEYNGQELYVVGGLALLSTVARGGTKTQRVIHRWQEDQIGELIEPTPIADWKAWRAALAIKNGGGIPAGTSRMKREMIERKARKGTLRAA